ncbi:entericidin B [Klebsiella michiganensis]|nr:entericidin B [Klebsiella michiganensis]
MVKKAIAAFFTVLALSSVLTACNTTRGVGQDISEGGSAISGRRDQSSAIDHGGTAVGRTVLPHRCHVVYNSCGISSTLRDGL